MKKENPYTILGVPADCDRNTVKEAYRILAKQHHPDMPNGSADKFQQIKRAHDVLLDPGLRRQFDTTGKMPDSDQHILDAAATTLIGTMMHNIILQCTPSELEKLDLIATMREPVAKGLLESKKELGKIGTKIDSMRKYIDIIEERSTGPEGKENMLVTAVTDLQRKLTEQCLHLNEDIRRKARVLEILDDYTFEGKAAGGWQQAVFTVSSGTS